MIFPTFEFAGFFLCVFVGFWYVFRRKRDRRLFLTAASYAFYAFWDWRFCFLLLASTAAAWFFGLLIGAQREHFRRKAVLVLSVVFFLLVLAFFKYWGAFSVAVNSLLERVAASGVPSGVPSGVSGAEPAFLLPVIQVALPVGLSFYTFKAMSYVFDVYLCKMPPSKDAVDVALYVSFFPQLASGPIVHAADFIPDIERAASAGIEPGSRPIELSRALALLGSGLFKKLVLANFLSTLFVDPVFSDLASRHSLEVLLAAFGYSAVIYADFSGYSDMAIAVALLLGFRTPANFRRPYAAFSVTDFWKRWHITFSSWLREYLYFSFGGSRFGKRRTLFALVATMMLGGLWHGPKATFVVWGAMQGVALALERAFGTGERKSASPGKAALQVTGTFLFATASWIVFRAGSLEAVAAWARALSNFGAPITLLTPTVLATLAVALGIHAIPDSARSRSLSAWTALPFPLKGVASALFLAALHVVSMSGVAPFIYFQF